MSDQEYAYNLMSKLTKDDYIRTFFTIAEMRPDDPHSDQVERCILPVDVYEKDGYGFEIMPVRLLAKNCPWDMTRTNVRVETEHTKILENLYNIVVEDAELHAHLTALDKERG